MIIYVYSVPQFAKFTPTVVKLSRMLSNPWLSGFYTCSFYTESQKVPGSVHFRVLAMAAGSCIGFLFVGYGSRDQYTPGIEQHFDARAAVPTTWSTVTLSPAHRYPAAAVRVSVGLRAKDDRCRNVSERAAGRDYWTE